MKKRAFLLILALALLLPAMAFAADARTSAYEQYSSSYKNYLDALKSEAPKETLDRLYEEYTASLERYRKLGGVPEQQAASPEVAAGSKRIASEGEASGEAGSPSLDESAGQRSYDAIIRGLEEKLAATRNPEDAAKVKIELAREYGRLKGDWKKASALLNEVASSQASAETRKKAVELAQDAKTRITRAALVRAVNDRRNASKELYKKYSGLSWTSPIKKTAALYSYWTGLIKYRKAAGEYRSFKEKTEKASQKLATTDATFDNITDSEPIPGNDITLLINGKCSFAKRYELARNARNYIYLEYLSYKNDPTGNKLGDILIAKAKEGVDVRVVIDYWTTFDYKKDIVYKLKAGGVKVSLYNSPFKTPTHVNNRNHQKLFIVDDTYAITGGMNIGDDYAMGSIKVEGWRDTDIMLTGPIVMDMKDLFLTNWEDSELQSIIVRDDATQKYRDEQEFMSRDFKVDESSMYKPSTNPKLIKEVLKEYFETPPTVRNVDLRFISHFPLNKDDHVLECMVWYIDRASSEVILQTPYFLPSKRLEQALISAARRGVAVTIITNSMYSNDMGKYIVWASHYFFQKLIENRIKIYEWYGSQTLHAKCNYFDGVAVTIGSYNLNSRSHGLDAEELVLVENVEFARIVRDVLAKDFYYCRQVTLEEARAWRESFSEKMKMNIFHLVDGIF